MPPPQSIKVKDYMSKMPPLKSFIVCDCVPSDDLINDTLAHVWVEHHRTCIIIYYTDRDALYFLSAEKPSSISRIDDSTWNLFRTKVGEKAKELNKKRYPSKLICFMLVVIFIGLIFGIRARHGWTLIGFCILIFINGYYDNLIIKKNQTIDEEILCICNRFKNKFERSGYSVEYRTQHTDAKTYQQSFHVPSRVVVFNNLPGNDETNTTNDETNTTDVDANDLETGKLATKEQGEKIALQTDEEGEQFVAEFKMMYNKMKNNDDTDHNPTDDDDEFVCEDKK